MDWTGQGRTRRVSGNGGRAEVCNSCLLLLLLLLLLFQLFHVLCMRSVPDWNTIRVILHNLIFFF